MKKIIDDFKKHFPKLTVTMIADYDKKTYLIEAVEKVGVPCYYNPYFLMRKDGKKCIPYMPTLFIEEFSRAVDERLIYRIKDIS